MALLFAAGALASRAASSCGGPGATGAGGATTSTSAKTDGGATTFSTSHTSSHTASGGAGGFGAHGGDGAGTGGTGMGGVGGLGAPMPCPGPGWEDWDDFAPKCAFCVPKTKADLPPPMEWEPCDPLAGMPTGCRQMKVTWPMPPPPYDDSPLAYIITAEVTQAGSVMFELGRLSRQTGKPYSMLMVAEADGPVHWAMLYAPEQWADYNGCAFFLGGLSAVRGGKTIAHIEGDDPSVAHPDGIFPEAVFGGDIDQLHPNVLQSWPSSMGKSPETSGMLWGVSDAYRIEVAAWGGDPQTVQSSADVEGRIVNQIQPLGSWASWRTSGGNRYSDIWASELGSKPYPFLIPANPATDSINGFTTDGVDMAWFRGKGLPPGGDVFPVRDIMTAPFTKDPAQIQPKRLRSYPADYAPTIPWVVGCGYAAMDMDYGHVLVVRLSDGWAWELPRPNCTPPNYKGDWCFDQPYALTCDELFVARRYSGTNHSIARVRLDALGPGMPPD